MEILRDSWSFSKSQERRRLSWVFAGAHNASAILSSRVRKAGGRSEIFFKTRARAPKHVRGHIPTLIRDCRDRFGTPTRNHHRAFFVLSSSSAASSSIRLLRWHLLCLVVRFGGLSFVHVLHLPLNLETNTVSRLYIGEETLQALLFERGFSCSSAAANPFRLLS